MRILLADDHPMISTAIEALLRNSPFEIAGMASTGEQALQKLDELNPDILLLDLQMPGGTGMDVLRRLKMNGSKVRVVLLTAAIDDASLLEAKSLRVQGMVLKNSDPAFLLECLDHVSKGRRWFDPELSGRAKELADTLGDREGPALSPRERQLINLVRKGLRNREIAEQLGVTEGTIKVYLHAVFEKLGVTSRTELAIRADEFLAGSFLTDRR
ncbi:two-component system response regulator NarL [Sphingomonas daechungensis]|uniref:Response regulator transcription factor n=1 Tax=Sphingomonas daechungensis TaxID=1176646 RepID=A0ABX6T506_9SPHN|nr:response regulator transcription factor [Sphingomonas daechungensis]QNP43793.1 response regulator transcription factor [Sphingomonas daechungensis]